MVIQRIQTVYLLLAAIAMAVFAFLPAVAVGQEMIGAFTQPNYLLACLDALVVVLAVIAIFKFKNLKLQMKLCAIDALLTLVLVTVAVVLAFRGHDASQVVPSLWLMLPVAAVVLFVLARRAIARDKKLLSDSTRLR